MAHGENAPGNITPGAIRFNTDSMKLEYFRIGMESGDTSSYAGIGTLAAGEWVQITTDTPDIQTGGTRGVFSGGNPATDVMDYINIASTGNAIDFGDLSASRLSLGATSDRTRGIVVGGYTSGGSNVDIIEFFTFASTGSRADFEDLTFARRYPTASSNGTRGLIAG